MGKDYILVLKKRSHKKGETPEHLKEFSADKTGLSICPIRCKGKKGIEFALCMKECAKELGITKKKD